jgi:NTP pyrophosphatase (non-canonical NTP hydrolase)
MSDIPSENDIKSHMDTVLSKWGNIRSPYIMLAVMQEELGEVAQEVLKNNPYEDIHRELIDLIVPALIMLDDMDYYIKSKENGEKND